MMCLYRRTRDVHFFTIQYGPGRSIFLQVLTIKFERKLNIVKSVYFNDCNARLNVGKLLFNFVQFLVNFCNFFHENLTGS